MQPPTVTSHPSHPNRRRWLREQLLSTNNLLHVERLESRAHPSSSILGLAVGSLLADENQFDLQSSPAPQAELAPSSQGSQTLDPQQIPPTPPVSFAYADNAEEVRSLDRQPELEPQRQSDFGDPAGQSSVPAWFQSLSQSLLSDDTPLDHTQAGDETVSVSGASGSLAANAAVESTQGSGLSSACSPKSFSSAGDAGAGPVGSPLRTGGAGGGGGSTVTYSDDVPALASTGESSAAAAGPSIALPVPIEGDGCSGVMFAMSSGCGCGCGCGCGGGGGGSGFGCGNTAPCVTRYNSCPAPATENLTSEVYLDHYDQTGYDKPKTIVLKDVFADNEEGDNPSYSIVSPPPTGVTAAFGTNSLGGRHAGVDGVQPRGCGWHDERRC